jgi:hypothetical protein
VVCGNIFEVLRKAEEMIHKKKQQSEQNTSVAKPLFLHFIIVCLLAGMFVCAVAVLCYAAVKIIGGNDHAYIELPEELTKKDKVSTVITAVGSCVFGIYLFDNLVRWQLLPLYLFLSEKTIGVFACSVYVILTFGVGLLYTFVLKKIPFIGKYI